MISAQRSIVVLISRKFLGIEFFEIHGINVSWDKINGFRIITSCVVCRGVCTPQILRLSGVGDWNLG